MMNAVFATCPLLTELELIEPELYFPVVAEAAARMAQLIVERLS